MIPEDSLGFEVLPAREAGLRNQRNDVAVSACIWTEGIHENDSEGWPLAQANQMMLHPWQISVRRHAVRACNDVLARCMLILESNQLAEG